MRTDQVSERPTGIELDILGDPAELDGELARRNRTSADDGVVDSRSGMLDSSPRAAGEDRRPSRRVSRTACRSSPGGSSSKAAATA